MVDRRLNGNGTGWRSTCVIVAFTIVVVGTFSAGLWLLGERWRMSAEAQARQNDVRALEAAINSHFTILARDQYTVSEWDDTVSKIVLKFDRTFVQDEIADTLWYNFDLDRTLIVAPNDRVLAYAREDLVQFEQNAPKPPPLVARLVNDARQRYMDNRVPIKGGYRLKHRPLGQLNELFVRSLQPYEGKLALVSATPITPNSDDVALPDGPATIMVSVKFLDDDSMRYLRGQSGLKGLDVVPAEDAVPAGETTLVYTDAIAGTVGKFIWKPAPVEGPWTLIVPAVAAASALFLAAGLTIGASVRTASSRLSRRADQTRHMALHDSLTGLANRLRLEQELNLALGEADRKPFAVFACDLDRFKAVNDRHGHAAGDLVIRNAARRLASTVGDAGMVARPGGDEFVVLVRGFADRARLTVLAQELISIIGAPITLETGVTTDIGISIGIVQVDRIGRNASDVMATADAALYASKEAGRGRAAFAEQAGTRVANMASVHAA